MDILVEKKLLCENTCAALYYYPETQIAELLFKPIEEVSDSDYRAIWTLGLKEVANLGGHKLLIDQRQIGKVQMQSRAWLLISWLPNAKRLMQNNFTAGILTTSDTRQKTGVQFLVDGIRRATSFNLHFFSDRAEAIEWMKVQ